MNTENKIAELTAEIDRLGLVLVERQAKIGQLMGEAARAGIAGGPVQGAGELPEGFALVPRALRQEMDMAIDSAKRHSASNQHLWDCALAAAPAAPAEQAEINLNEQFACTLTATGAKAWNARYTGLALPVDLIPAPASVGDVVKDSLWALMQVFGPYIHMGSEPPFERCAIRPAPTPAAPLPEQTGPSDAQSGLLLSARNLFTVFSCDGTGEPLRKIALKDLSQAIEAVKALAASPSPAPAQPTDKTAEGK